MPDNQKSSLDINTNNYNSNPSSHKRDEFYEQSAINTPTIHIPLANYMDYGNSQYDTGAGTDVVASGDFNELRAQRQSSLDKAGNSVIRLAGRTATAAGEIVGNVYGLAKLGVEMNMEPLTKANYLKEHGNLDGYKEPTWTTIFDNELTRTLDNVDKAIKSIVPQYQSKDYQNAKWYEKMQYANFYFDDLADAAGFALGSAAGGAMYTKFIGSAFKLAKAGAVEELTQIINDGKKLGLSADQIAANVSKSAGKVKAIDYTDKVLTSMAMGTTESGSEARGTGDDFEKNMISDLEKSQGFKVSESQKEYIKLLKDDAMKSSYLANILITGPTNMIIQDSFLKGLKGIKKEKSLIDDAFEGAVERKKPLGDYIPEQRSKFGSMASSMGKTIKNNGLEALQEMAQTGIDKGVQDFHKAKYSGKSGMDQFLKSTLYGTSEAFSDQGLLSGLLGFLTPGVSNTLLTKGGNIKEALGNFSDKQKKDLAYSAMLNKLSSNNLFKQAYEAASKQQEFKDALDNAIDEKNDFEIKNRLHDLAVNTVLARVKTGKMQDLVEDLEYFKTLNPEDFKELTGMELDKDSMETVVSFVQDKITKAKDINKTYEDVKTLFPEMSGANRDRLVHATTAAKDSAKRAEQLSKEVNQIVFDHKYTLHNPSQLAIISQPYNTLYQENKEAYKEEILKSAISPVDQQVIIKKLEDIDKLTQRGAAYVDVYNKITKNKFHEEELDKSDKGDEEELEKKDLEEQKSYKEHLEAKTQLVDKIMESEDHSEIQSLTDELAKNPLLEKEDIDKVTEKFEKVKAKSIRRKQISNQIDKAKKYRDEVLSKLFTANIDIETKANEVNQTIEDYKAGNTKLSQDKVFKMIDDVQSDIFKLRDHVDSLEKELIEADEEINRLQNKLQAQESIRATTQDLEHKQKELEYVLHEINSAKNKISKLEKLLRKLKQIFKVLFPNASEILNSWTQDSKGKRKIYENTDEYKEIDSAQKEITTKEAALKELKGIVKELTIVEADIMNDIFRLQDEITEYYTMLNSTQLSFKVEEVVSDENAIEIVDHKETPGEFKAKKDIAYAFISTAGNNMKGETEELTSDPDQLRWFEHTSKMQVGSMMDNQLMAITSANNPFGTEVKFYDKDTILLVLHKDGKPVEVEAKKADIERRRQEIERIKKLPFQERIQALIKSGIIDNKGLIWGGRQIIILNIEGEKLPFYRSAFGTGGKTKGKWHPMFGFGKSQSKSVENDWLIKGSTSDSNNEYNSKAIKEYSEIINSLLNWEHSIDGSTRFLKDHPFLNSLKSITEEQLNKILYNNEDSGVVNDGGESIEKSFDIIRRIDKAYNSKDLSNTKESKPVKVDGHLIYTSMRLPMTADAALEQFTNKKEFTKGQVELEIANLKSLRDKIFASKEPLFLQVTGKTKGIAVNSKVTNAAGKTVFRFPVYGRLTKNTKDLDKLGENIFVAKSNITQVGSQTIDTVPGMVYISYDGQVIPLRVAKLGEIKGGVDKAVELIEKLMQINSPDYQGKELFKDVYDQLNLLILAGNVKADSDFKIFVTKDGRLYYNGKYHDSINTEDLKLFLENKYIRVNGELLKSNPKIKNPITGEKSSYRFYLLNNKNKADDQVLLGTSLVNLDQQQFKNVGLKFDNLSEPKTENKPEVKNKVTKVEPKDKAPEITEIPTDPVELAFWQALNPGVDPKTILNKTTEVVTAETEDQNPEDAKPKVETKTDQLNQDDKDDLLNKLQQASDDKGDSWDRTFLPVETPATKEELAKEEAWFKVNFPQIDYQRVRSLIDNKAVGRFLSSGKVLISDLAAKGTTYHEAWHTVSQLFLTEEELVSVYQDYRERTGFKGTTAEMEELIAEDFRNYMLGEKTTFTPKTKSIFQKIVDFIKGLFKLDNSSLDNVFSNIKQGKYKSSKIVDKTSNDFYRALPGKDTAFTKDVLDSMNIFFFKNLLAMDEDFSIEDIHKVKNISDIYNKVFNNFLATFKGYPKELQEALFDNYSYLNKNWNVIVAEHIKSLSKYGVSIKLKDIPETEQENIFDSDTSTYEEKVEELSRTTKDNTYVDTITYSTKDNMPKAVKLLIASLPQGRMVDGKFKVDINATFGTPKNVDFNKSIDYLHNKLAGSTSLKEMIATMSAHINERPEIFVMLKYLKASNSEVTPTTLSSSQFNLQMKFFQQFAKTKNTYLTTMVDAEGNIYSFDSNSSRLGDKIKTIWKNNRKDSVNDSNGFYTLTNDGIITIDKNRVNAIAKQFPLGNISNALKFLSKFGVEFSTDKFTAEEEELIKKAALKILEYAVNQDAVDIFQKDVVGSSISDLINIEANHNTEEVELQHINPEGKTVYGITLNTYLSLLVNKVNSSGELSHMDVENNPYTKSSIWKELIQEGKKIILEVAEGLKSDEQGTEGVITSDLDMTSNLQQSLNLVLNNRFPFLRAGDKKLEYLFKIDFDMDKELFIERMLMYYRDDAMRTLSLKQGQGANIQFYKEHANKSLIFEDISSIYPNFNKITTEKGIDKFIKDNEEKLKRDIEDYLVKQIQEGFKEPLIKYKMIEDLKNGTYKVNGIDKATLTRLIGKSDIINEAELNRLGELFLTKSFVANVEQTKLFTGDLAFYDILKGDFNKRTGGLTGPKKVANTDASTDEWLNENRKRTDGKLADGKIRTIVYKDVVSVSEYLNEYIKVIGKEKAMNAYKNMKEADAQGYITLDEYREFFERSGEWTEQHEKAYQKLIKGEKLTKDEFQYFMPIKPQYFGPQTSNGLYIPTYYKLSLMPLLPTMIKGRKLEQLAKQMKDNKVGIAMFASANKVGANLQEGKLVDFYDNSGNVVNNTIIQEINYSYLGIQLDIAPISKDKVTFGTQVRKLILSNLFTNGKSKVIQVLRNGTLTKVDTKDIKSEYDSIINNLTSIRRDKLKKRLNLVSVGDNKFRISDIKEFKKVIISEAESREVADNLIASLELALEGDNKYVDATISKVKIEQILYSLVNNNVISQKMFGDMKVMGSATGFEVDTRRFNDISDKEKSAIQWVGNSQTLKFYHKSVTGSTSKMQVLIPSWFKEIIGDDLTQFDKRLLEIVGYRTPTQGLNSIDSIEVVGFLPKEAGNLIITPSEIVGKAGSDYDVDKLSIFLPKYLMVAGKPQYIPTNKEDQKKLYEFIKENTPKFKKTFEEFLEDNKVAIYENRVIEITKEILSSPEMYDQLILPNSTDTLLEMVAKVRELLGKDKRKITGTKLLQWFDNAVTAVSFWSGKAGVGISALHNTSHILSQQSGLFITPEGKTMMNLSHNITENGDIDLSGEFDNSGKQRISDIINEFVNAYVDIAKDPFIFDLNAGVQTAGVWFYLIRAGVPLQTITMFMRQPIIWDYVVQQSINESVLNKTMGKELSKDKLIGAVREMYNLSKFDKREEFSFDENNLAENIKPENRTSDKFFKEQQAILTEFLEYQRIAKSLGELMQATNADTKGAGKNRNSARRQIKNLDAIQDSGLFGNLDKYIDDSILKEFIQTVRESGNYYNDLFITDNEKVRPILDEIEQAFEAKNFGAEKINELMDIAENELITYIIHSQGQDKLVDKIDELFKGDSSLAQRLIAAKKNPKLKGNLFIQNAFPLVSNDRKNIDNVKQYSKKLNTYESNMLTEAYRELYNIAPGLADDLTKLGILQSGLNNSPISYVSVIPSEKFFEIASKTIDLVAASDEANLDDFFDLFYQNNYNNANIVTKIPSWIFNSDYGKPKAMRTEDGIIFASENGLASQPFLKEITADYSLSKAERNEKQARGENIFITRLYKKVGEKEFVEVPTKGNGIYLRDYRKTDNVVVRSEPVFSENMGRNYEAGSVGMSAEDLLHSMGIYEVNDQNPEDVAPLSTVDPVMAAFERILARKTKAIELIKGSKNLDTKKKAELIERLNNIHSDRELDSFAEELMKICK